MFNHDGIGVQAAVRLPANVAMRDFTPERRENSTVKQQTVHVQRGAVLNCRPPQNDPLLLAASDDLAGIKDV